MTSEIDRRKFIGFCGKSAMAAGVAGASGLLPNMAMADLLEDAPTVKLLGKDGTPLKVADLAPNQTLIFNYPYVATPVMLIVLDGPTAVNSQTEDGEGHTYLWQGGVGPEKNIVAYSAICAHLLSYVGHETAFLHYSPEENEFGHAKVISCCAHGSSYDPADGAKVVTGPAEYPLATVNLAYDAADDSLSATGVIGTELFKKFYDSFRQDLRSEYGRAKYRKIVTEGAVALPIDEYSQYVLEC
jgi:Rieske Fe-S protein